MRPRNKIQMVIGAGSMCASILLLAGCPNSRHENSGNERNPVGSKPPSIRAALALDVAGVDDKSFNAASWAGLQKAKTTFGAEVKYLEAKTPADYKTNMSAFANQNYDIVFAGSYAFDDAIKDVAPQFPNVKFTIIDGNPPPNVLNASSINFHEEQATFLAGYLAASLTKNKAIGFVGGMEIPLIKKFQAGYIAGARTANPQVRVLSSFTGDWNDLSKGKSQAAQQFGNGVDIIFQAAGKAGLGVIEAAREKGPGYFAIGVDSNQDDVAPGRVLTSCVKHLDTAVFDVVKQVKEGHFSPGRHIYGLKDGGVGLTDMKNTKQNIPSVVLTKLAKLTKMIIDGQVVPPTTTEELNRFTPPRM